MNYVNFKCNSNSDPLFSEFLSSAAPSVLVDYLVHASAELDWRSSNEQANRVAALVLWELFCNCGDEEFADIAARGDLAAILIAIDRAGLGPWRGDNLWDLLAACLKLCNSESLCPADKAEIREAVSRLFAWQMRTCLEGGADMSTFLDLAVRFLGASAFPSPLLGA